MNTSVPVGNADERTAQALAQAALRVDLRLTGVRVVVASLEGVAQLDGHVASQADYELADQLVRAVPGVSRVSNGVQIGLPRLLWSHG